MILHGFTLLTSDRRQPSPENHAIAARLEEEVQPLGK
jgi:hypothetical protein